MADLLMKMPIPFEPKRKNRFLLTFDSSLGINQWYVETAQRPSSKTNNIEIPFLNTSTYVAGRFVWNDMKVLFRDPIGPSAAQALMEWYRLCSETVTGRQGYAAGYKKDVWLEMLDPGGVVIEKWYLEKCWITDIDFGTLGYNDDKIADINVTLRPDRCVLIY